jgi:transposase
MAKEKVLVFGGVDTHKDVHVAAVIDERGKILDTAEFGTTAAEYQRLESWLRSFGCLVKVGVEGTGAYGAGLVRHLAKGDIEVVEVNRPNRQMRRRRGKSDTVDAEAAARSALNGEAAVVPKTQVSVVESIRVLRIAYCSARSSRTRAALQIRDLIVTAPDQLRRVLGPMTTTGRVAQCARFRVGSDRSNPAEATKLALRTLARRHEALSEEMADLHATIDELTAQANPALRGALGGRPRHRGHSLGRRRRQPRAFAQRGLVRIAVRGLAHSSVVGNDRAASTQSIGQPPSESCAVAHRHGQTPVRPSDKGLRRATAC